MKVLSITLSLAILLAFAPAVMAVDVFNLPMGEIRAQFTYGPVTTFSSYMDSGGTTRAGAFMWNTVANAVEHLGDGNINPLGMLNGVKLADIAQINIGYLQVDDNDPLGVYSPWHRNGEFNYVVDWDGDMNPATQPADSLGDVGFRIHMDLLYSAMVSNSGLVNSTYYQNLPLDTWVDLKLTPQLQCLEVANSTGLGLGVIGNSLYDPNGNPALTTSTDMLSLNQMTAKFPNARFSGLGGWSWSGIPDPNSPTGTQEETVEITVDAGGFPIANGLYYDYYDVYFGNRLQGDTNGDMLVDVGDLGILSAGWGTKAAAVVGPNGLRFAADFNGDLIIDVGDLGILSANWGSTIASTWTSNLTNFTDVAGGLGLDGGAVPLPSAFGAGLVLMGLAARRRR